MSTGHLGIIVLEQGKVDEIATAFGYTAEMGGTAEMGNGEVCRRCGRGGRGNVGRQAPEYRASDVGHDLCADGIQGANKPVAL